MFNTEEFYKQHYPTQSELTVRNVKNMLAGLDPNHVQDWIDQHNTLEEKRKKLILAVKFAKYLDIDEEEMEKYQDEIGMLNDIQMAGGKLTSKQDDDYYREFDEIHPKLWRQHITPWNLFGFWLPPRRNDIFELMININHSNQTINQYVVSENKFYFYNYKMSKTKGVESFLLDSTTFPFLTSDQIAKARQFLQHRSGGRLFPTFSFTDHYSRNYKKINGFNVNSLRHCWAHLGRTRFTRAQYLALCRWMSHSPATSLTVYS